jgi:hypothetical protein
MELCDRHNPDQMPYGLMEKLAGKLGKSKRSVQRAARLLEQHGVLRMEPLTGRRCCLFRLNFDWMTQFVSPQEAAACVTPKPGFVSPQVPVSCHPEPSLDFNQGREPSETRASARPPASSPVDEILVDEGKEACIEAETVEAEEPEPDREMVQLVVESGLDPAEVPEELRDCARGGRVTADHWQPTAADRACAVEFGHDWNLLTRRFVNHYAPTGRKFTLAEWSGKFRNWCLPDPRYSRPAKRDRVSEAEAWVANSVAIVRAAQRMEAAL